MGRAQPIVAISQKGEILAYYESIAEAARMNGFSESSISNAISNGGTSYRVKWMKEADYRDVWMKGNTEELKYSYKEIKSERIRKGWRNSSPESRARRGANISKSKKRSVQEHPESMEKARRARMQPVFCVSTGAYFDSIKSFAEAYGLNRITTTGLIWKGYRVHGMIVKKITKEEYEDYNKRRNQEKDCSDPA